MADYAGCAVKRTPRARATTWPELYGRAEHVDEGQVRRYRPHVRVEWTQPTRIGIDSHMVPTSSLDSPVLADIVRRLVAAYAPDWWITGGQWGTEWKKFAAMSAEMPSRVATQSYTFMSPMGDTVRYLMEPTKLGFVNFAVVALVGVVVGSFSWAIAVRRFRVEWFVNAKDFLSHAVGGVLMGIGGPLAMGCTIGQAITGISNLAIGSLVTFLSIVVGAASTMKYQYRRMMHDG